MLLYIPSRALPAQGGQARRFLSTDGAQALWRDAVETLDNDATTRSNSGTTQVTLWSKTIQANSLGTARGVRVLLLCTIQHSAGDSVTLRLKLGTNTQCTIVVPSDGSGATEPLLIEGWTRNNGAANSQRHRFLVTSRDSVGAVTVRLDRGQSARDTTQDQLYEVTAQAAIAMVVTNEHAELELI